MSSAAGKDFGEIADDYAFFEAHASEADADAGEYLRRMAELDLLARRELRMLDFGCGSGTFTERLLSLASWPAEGLRLSLVEPAELLRNRAVERLAKFTRHPLDAAATLPAGVEGTCQLVLANHSLYYVDDLDSQLKQLIGAVAPDGVCLTSIAGRDNALIAFWLAAFAWLGRPVPHHIAEDVAAALERLGTRYERRSVPYRLEFDDSAANRLKIVRFLLADYLAELPVERLLAMFDPFVCGDRIAIETACEQFSIGR